VSAPPVRPPAPDPAVQRACIGFFAGFLAGAALGLLEYGTSLMTPLVIAVFSGIVMGALAALVHPGRRRSSAAGAGSSRAGLPRSTRTSG